MHYTDKLDQIFNNGINWEHRSFRTVLNPASAEYKETTAEEKLELLRIAHKNGLPILILLDQYKEHYTVMEKEHVAEAAEQGLAQLLSDLLDRLP